MLASNKQWDLRLALGGKRKE